MTSVALINLIPYDGEVYYYPHFFKNPALAFSLLNEAITWKNDEVILFGKHIITKRFSAWYGDQGKDYTYAGIARKAVEWPTVLAEIRSELGAISAFNSCLCNLYPSGNEGMGWHTDNERSLGKNPIIASISFGAERKFAFKHQQTQEKVELTLGNGSLLIMQGTVQHFWKHSLPKTKKVNQPRINLTFREIKG